MLKSYKIPNKIQSGEETKVHPLGQFWGVQFSKATSWHEVHRAQGCVVCDVQEVVGDTSDWASGSIGFVQNGRMWKTKNGKVTILNYNDKDNYIAITFDIG